MKPGHKTTEFWVTLGTQVVAVLTTIGVFSPEQSTVMSKAIIQAAGVVAMVLSAAGYSSSRGNAKKG